MITDVKNLTPGQCQQLQRFEEDRAVIAVHETFFLARCLQELGGHPDHTDWTFNRELWRFERADGE